MAEFKYKFSVIIPTYNRANLLERCLNSLVEQTFKDFEVLVCDDGSTDNTKEISQKFESVLDIKYLWEENWGGPARPRNRGIAVSKGEWICFLDSDDWWFSNKLEEVRKCILSNDYVDFICHELLLSKVNQNKKQILHCGPIVPNLYENLLNYGDVFLNSAISIRKSTLVKFDLKLNESKSFVGVEDYDLCLKLASFKAIFVCINMPLGEYYQEGSNISLSSSHLVNLESLLKYHVFEYQNFEQNKKKLWKKVSSRLNIIKAVVFFNKREYTNFFIHMFMSIRQYRHGFFKYAWSIINQSVKDFYSRNK